jgi:hypothetical protein
MGDTTKYFEKQRRFDPADTRLLRSARRIIRLYDLSESKHICVKTESVAQIIAEELNRKSDG